METNLLSESYHIINDRNTDVVNYATWKNSMA